MTAERTTAITSTFVQFMSLGNSVVVGARLLTRGRGPGSAAVLLRTMQRSFGSIAGLLLWQPLRMGDNREICVVTCTEAGRAEFDNDDHEVGKRQ